MQQNVGMDGEFIKEVPGEWLKTWPTSSRVAIHNDAFIHACRHRLGYQLPGAGLLRGHKKGET
eukprot:3142382-Amphidinium_carterae.1